MQLITISGRLGSDAKLAHTQTGDAVCNFNVAVDYRNGRDKATNWWRVSLWGKRAEALSQYLVKGSSVTVAGEFGLSEYEGKPQLNIRASEIALQGSKSEQSDNRREPDGSRGAPADRGGFQDDLDDNIPFATNDSIW